MTSRMWLWAAVLGLSVPAAAADGPQQPPICLRMGAMVPLMVLTEVSSDRAKIGDVIKMRLQRDMSAGDVVILRAGTPAFGVVEAGSKGNLALRDGQLMARLTHMVSDGARIELQGYVSRHGQSWAFENMLKTTLLPVHSLFSPGNAGKLKAGDMVDAVVGSSYIVTGAPGSWVYEPLNGRDLPAACTVVM